MIFSYRLPKEILRINQLSHLCCLQSMARLLEIELRDGILRRIFNVSRVKKLKGYKLFWQGKEYFRFLIVFKILEVL